MSKISLELFDRAAEVISFEDEKAAALIFEFDKELDGYLLLGKVTAKIKGKSCALDVRNLEFGEHIPYLILEDATIDLPKIKNENGAIFPVEPGISEIGNISLRERRLDRRVNELEARLDEISKKVFGTSIF